MLSIRRHHKVEASLRNPYPTRHGMAQVAWRPLNGGESEWQEPQEAILVLSSGRLLHGSVGRELYALEWMSNQQGAIERDQHCQPGALVAWSEGGRVVAVGIGSRVTFWDFASQRSCWAADVSQLVSCAPNLSPRPVLLPGSLFTQTAVRR